MATNSSVKKIITIEVQGNQAKASIDGVTMSTKQLNTELERLSKVGGKAPAGGTTGATGGATATVLELGRTISDSNYGIRGMANNLSQLVSNLVFTTRAAGGLAAGLKSIWSAMMGPLGLVLAGQAVIAMLERFSMESEKATEASEGFNKSLQNEITTLKIYEEALADANISLQERVGIVKGLSKLDKNLSDKLKDAAGDTEKLTKITKDYLAEKERELEIDLKRLEIQELYNKRLELTAKKTKIEEEIANKTTADFVTRNGERAQILVAQDKIIADLSDTQLEYNNAVEDYLKLMSLTNQEEEKRNKKTKTRTKKAKAPVFGDPIFDVDALMEGYDESKTLEFDLRRRYLDSRALFYDEARIQASESNNRILEDEIAHREKMLIQADMGSLERIQAENELAMMRMDLLDQEFEHEMLLLDLKMQAQMEYVGFVTGIGDVLAGLGKRSEELATLSLVVQKGAAIAEVVIAASQSIAARMAAHALIPPFITMPMGISIPNPVKAIDAAAMGKDITMTKVGAGISIAAILATAIKGGKRSITSGGGRAGGAEGTGGGRTFDFNLVGSTGTNQLAEAVGAQFQEPIQAFVVSSQVTSQQELDLEISTGASLGG